MACLICGRSSDYDLVRDGETEAEVCRPCTEEFLAVDEGDPTCVYCDRNGVYDVRTQADGGFPDEETTADTFSTPYESVLCEEHFAELGDEEPAGSPEAADESDVAGESEAEGEEGEADESEAEGEEGEADESGAEDAETEDAGPTDETETEEDEAAGDESEAKDADTADTDGDDGDDGDDDPDRDGA